MFDDTLVLHGVCRLQTMCPQYISLAKMGCHFGSRIRTLILQDQRLSKPTLHSLLILRWPLRQLRRCQFAHLIQYLNLCRLELTCSARVSKLSSPRRASPTGSWPKWRARGTPPWKTWLARQHAARDLQFVNDDHGWTAELRALISMKLFQCVRLAKEAIGETPTGLNLGRDHPALPAGKATGLDTVCDRRQILIDWDRMAQQPRPKLTYQGSDNFLKKQFKLCALGEIGFFQTKNIISALPDTDEKPIKVKRKATFDGWEREIEEEERAFPTTRDQIKKMHQVFRNNLYMCLISFPQHPQFNVTKTDLDDWYEWFWGKDIKTGNPHHQNRPSSMPSGMPGERFTTRCTRGAPSEMLCKQFGRTASSGHGRSTRDAKLVPRATPWAKASPKVRRAQGGPRDNRSGPKAPPSR